MPPVTVRADVTPLLDYRYNQRPLRSQSSPMWLSHVVARQAPPQPQPLLDEQRARLRVPIVRPAATRRTAGAPYCSNCPPSRSCGSFPGASGTYHGPFTQKQKQKVRLSVSGDPVDLGCFSVRPGTLTLTLSVGGGVRTGGEVSEFKEGAARTTGPL